MAAGAGRETSVALALAICGAPSGESLAHRLEVGVSLGESLELVGQLGLKGDRPVEPDVEDRNDPTHSPLAPGDLTLVLELLALEPSKLDARGGLLAVEARRAPSEPRSFRLSASMVRSSDIAVSFPLVLRGGSFRSDGPC